MTDNYHVILDVNYVYLYKMILKIVDINFEQKDLVKRNPE